MRNNSAKRLSTNLVKLLLKIILLLISVSSITSLRSLVFVGDNGGYDAAQGFGFYPMNFLKAVFRTFSHLFTLYDSTFTYYGIVYDVFPYIVDKYLYTMSILFSALVITIVVSFFFSFVYLFFSRQLKRMFKILLLVADSIPDIIIILVSQLLVIRLYQATGFKILKLYGIGNNIYLLPIICLSLVPIVMVNKIMIKIFEEEIEEQYVEFAFSKGLSRSTVFLKHVVRNVMKSLYSHISLIYLYMLSSLFVIEYLFQIKGFTLLLYRISDSSLNSVAMILILIPFGLLKAASFRFYERRVLNE
ncbi:MAG TPA: ABC transporter permease subunit [Neobacillus sp.]|jgi:ABC-type dipeptide/oligopeptide/nickel transport system permease component